MEERGACNAAGGGFSGKPMRRNAKDSLFCSLFSEEENVLALYRELHPEDAAATVDDVRIVTLQNIVTAGMYNDLGFTVRDRLLVLAEAQTRWSPNITVRMLLYLADTYKRLLDEKGLSLHRVSPLPVPVSDLVVIYTGRGEVPSDISLIRDVQGLKPGGSAVEVRARVISEPGQGIAGQYVAATRIADKMRDEGDIGPGSADRFVKKCMENGILEKFMQNRRAEVVSMLNAIFDQEREWDLYFNEVLNETAEKATAQGIEQGIEKGMAQKEASLLAALMKNTGMAESEARAALGLEFA